MLDKLNFNDNISKTSDQNDYSLMREENIFNKDFLNNLNSPKSVISKKFGSSSSLSLDKISKFSQVKLLNFLRKLKK